MKKSIDMTATDLIDPQIRKVAPFYGLNSSLGLNEQLGLKPIGPQCRRLRFPTTYEKLRLDEETGATWETFELGPNTEHWYHGQITINEERVGEYFRGLEYNTLREDLIPDIFLGGGLVVSDKARKVIEDVAPGFCYFTPAKFIGAQTGKQLSRPIFKVYVRRTLSFEGPPQRPVIRAQGERVPLVDPNSWTSFCHNQAVQDATKDLPVFLFDRFQKHPIFRADLFRELRRANISGLLESTYHDTVAPEKSGKLIDFETVFPLDPEYR